MYNVKGVIDCRELLKISKQRKISQTERFRINNALDVWKHIRVWEYISYLRWSKSNLKTEFEWQTKHRMIVSDLHH